MARCSNITTLGALAAAIFAVVLTPPAISQAADLSAPYNPGVLGDQRVEFASSWYIRGDVGYEQTSQKLSTSNALPLTPPDLTFDGSQGHENGYSLTLGGGYKINDWFRVDAIGEVRKDLHAVTTGTTDPNCIIAVGLYIPCHATSTASLNRYDVLANGYIDLGTWGSFTPYVGVGAGAAFGQVATSASWSDLAGTHYDGTYQINGTTVRYFRDGSANRTYVNFAWALMAGVAFDVYDHVKLDVGYRYFNAGRIPNPSGSGASTALVANEIRVGLRYMID